MKGINHLVLTGHDLEALRSKYQALGFTVTPRGQHPFGTGNSIIQLPGTYLELLSVTVPQDVPEHSPGQFSFAAFNRDYLARHEGFSMMALDTPDARADIQSWRAAGLQGRFFAGVCQSPCRPVVWDIRLSALHARVLRAAAISGSFQWRFECSGCLGCRLHGSESR